MERILKILIISIVSFLVALWVITGVNSCRDKKAEVAAETESDTTTMLEDTVELTEDIFAEGAGSDTTTISTTAPATNTTNNSELTNYVDDQTNGTEEEKISPVSETKTTETKPKPQEKSSSTSRPFMIIAGNYIDKSNADVMKNKLLKLNFNNSEVVNFDMSQYFTVIAGRYKTQEEASGLVSKLKNKGIDCYVKKRQN
ncbi:MAG: SPOR domain-containing protein [Deltaproteobacteria bacterium]